jgi:hypothetical protein
MVHTARSTDALALLFLLRFERDRRHATSFIRAGTEEACFYVSCPMPVVRVDEAFK